MPRASSVAPDRRPAGSRAVLDYRVHALDYNSYDLGEELATPRAAPDGPYPRLFKPLFDRLAAAALLIVLMPVMVIVAAVVRLTLGRGVLLRQQRVGLHGQPFTLVKFRTMRPCRRLVRADELDADRRRVHKTEADPRHTTVGRFLRKWSLDELPELLNVLTGRMSLVGPRPELPGVVARYEPWQHRRHLAKPGLTGLWQVSHRGEGMMHEFSHVDIEYVRCLSPGLDARILLMTVPALLVRRGS